MRLEFVRPSFAENDRSKVEASSEMFDFSPDEGHEEVLIVRKERDDDVLDFERNARKWRREGGHGELWLDRGDRWSLYREECDVFQ